MSIFLLLALAGCSDSLSTPAGTVDTTPPAVLTAPALQMAPNAAVPLAGLLTLETDEPTRVSVVLVLEDGTTQSSIAFPTLAVSHSLTVLGFRPNTIYEIAVSVSDAAGNTASIAETIPVTTGTLPLVFPVMTVISQPDRMEPGVTLLSLQQNLWVNSGSGREPRL